MKKLLMALITAGLMLNGAAFADDGANENAERGKGWEKAKARILDNIAKRRAMLDGFENCVKSASSKDAMKSCRKEHREKMKAMRAERRGNRQDRRDQFRGQGRGQGRGLGRGQGRGFGGRFQD